MRELEENRPDYLVYVDVWDSWGDRSGGPLLADFLARLQEYRNQNFERVGIVDIGEPTDYLWDDAAKTYVPNSSKVIYLFKRKTFLAPQTATQRGVPAANQD